MDFDPVYSQDVPVEDTGKSTQSTAAAVKYEISPIIGILILEDNSYDNSLMFGVRSLITITKKYALEGEIGFSPSSFRYGIDDGNSTITTIEEGIRIFNYGGNYL